MRYELLICSLPALPKRFDAGPPPISEERLRKRLRLLTPEHADEVRRLFGVLAWNDQFAETNDEAVKQHYEELIAGLRDPLTREAAAAMVDARMVVTALRARKRGNEPPITGIGRFERHIRRHFAEPGFRLAHTFRRLPELEARMQDGDALGFHRAAIGATWDWLTKRAQDHLFDFGAVVLYVARWAIVQHWNQQEAGRGRAIFESLVTEALGEHA